METRVDINRPWAESLEVRRAREQVVHQNTIAYRFDQVVAYLEYLIKDADNQESKDGFASLIPKLRAIQAKAARFESKALDA